MTNAEIITELRNQFFAATDAWDQAKREAREAGLMNPPEVIRLARLTSKLQGELTLAKQGRFRKPLPAGQVSCDRCGGFGGHNQWPGFVCFKCDGLGHVAS